MDLATGRTLVQHWRTGQSTAAITTGPAPMSTNQRGILLFERLHPGTAVFNVCFAARHTGGLDEERLDRALSILLRRHPALRSTFVDGDEATVRIVRDSRALSAQWTDLRHLPAAQRCTAASQRVEQVAIQPFDLERGPLVRVHGFRLGADECLLLFVAHHSVCDGVSQQILLAELDAAYRGALTGQVPDAIPPPFDREALGYWRDHLANLPELDLQPDHGRAVQAPFRGGSVPLGVGEDVVAAAERLGRSENATLYMVLLAAFQLLLSEHSDQIDFAVGSPEAGRARAGQHGVVGLLSDLLVLRTDLSGRPSFRELVRRARDTCLAAWAHRQVPFEEVVAAVAPGGSLDSALVQASLVFHGDRGAPTLAGSPLEPVIVPRPGLRYAVELHLWREQGWLRGSWDYSTEAFLAVTAGRMAARLPVLLARALAEPDRPVDRLDLLTDEERSLLGRWGRGPEAADPDTTLPVLFTAQVARTPDAVATCDGHRELTYRELDERSNQLAHYLRGRGVGVGDIVGIRLSRSVDLLVAMLGILKTGAAHLPLDPAYPADRTEYMLTDSSAREVVTERELGELDGQPVSAVEMSSVRPDDLAYVLYTSGSTGRPKGVMVTHRNAVALVLWGQRAYTAEEMSRVLASTSICFDVSAFELYAPLCAGGTVVVVDNALTLLADPPDVTMVCVVPTAARALVAAGALPRSVRVVGLGGEPVPAALAHDLYATGHVKAVVNLYGPTEDTTYSTYARLLPGEQPPPIGALLTHGRGYVLDRALRRVPVGAVGELFLAGRGVTSGYIGKPGLTASRYVADPFGVPGERMYRTGDLVRYRSDGALLYIGRRDFQVKVRGQRIELEEIENTMQRHPDVRQAVVALREDRLVGYLTARRSTDLKLDDVRAYLRRTLPVVMVPSSLVLLDALPQMPNGKVDRHALPAPDLPVGVGGEPPRGADEELVAKVWREILELDDIGRDDDFFDLGGDSLLAGQVLNRLRERAGRGLPLRLVFENSRLADLAAALTPPTDQAAPSADRPAVGPRPPEAEPVLSFDQQRVWLDSMVKSAVAYNVHGRRWLRGRLDVAVLDRSIGAIVARHESLRTTFPFVDGQPVQRVSSPDRDWRITVRNLSTLGPGAAAAAERLADGQAATAFDLAEGPLFDVLLLRLGDTDHLLSITIHHLISDAWSIGLFLRELSALYRAGGDPDAAGLPALPVQYLDYAVWQRAWLRGDRLAAQVEHWRDRLAGAPPALALPTARRRSPAQGTVGGRLRATLGADEAAALHQLCRDHEVTPFMVLFAALVTLLHRWSGQDDLVVGVPVNTRGDAGTDGLIGLFVNTVPLRVDLAGHPSFREVLGRVREASLDDYANHGETPFDVLVRELRVARDPSRTPLFQVLLSMIDDAEQEWRLPGISVEATEQPAQPSKVDLNLNVHQRGDAIELELLYHADRYDAPTMRALLDQLQAVLAGAADDPTRGIMEYELAAPTVPDDAPPESVTAPHLALERRAHQEPDRIAVIDRDASWTYRQLADAAARVAGSVAGRKAGEVAVVDRRTAGFAAAVLGCAKAAVPYDVLEPGVARAMSAVLDPDPDERSPQGAVDVRAMLRRTTGGSAERGPERSAGRSGGSGTAGSDELGDWAVQRFDLTADDRIAVLSGSSGLFLSALSTAVTAGATLVVVDDAAAADPDALATWLRAAAVTAAYLTPPVLRTLARRPAEPVLPLLRYAFLDNSGDLTSYDVDLVRQLAPACRVVGVYGTTGVGVPLAVYAVPSTWSSAAAPLRVPIGTPVAAAAVPRNAAGRPAAIGEVARLRLGTEPAGDPVRRRPDGVLELAGPAAGDGPGAAPYADPLEVVATLRDLPDVRDAVVTERLGLDGVPALAAYVADPDQAVDLARLRQHLVTQLPAYLIPRQVVVVGRLPLTADGAYDLAALPDPVSAGALT